MIGIKDYQISDEWSFRYRVTPNTEIAFVLEHYIWHLANVHRHYEFAVSRNKINKFLDVNNIGDLKTEVIDCMIDLPHAEYIVGERQIWPYSSIIYSDRMFFIKLDNNFMKHISQFHSIMDKLLSSF